MSPSKYPMTKGIGYTPSVHNEAHGLHPFQNGCSMNLLPLGTISHHHGHLVQLRNHQSCAGIHSNIGDVPNVY